MEGVDDLGRLGQDDRVDRRIGIRHVQGAEDDSVLPAFGLLSSQAATSVKVRLGKMSII